MGRRHRLRAEGNQSEELDSLLLLHGHGPESEHDMSAPLPSGAMDSESAIGSVQARTTISRAETREAYTLQG